MPPTLARERMVFIDALRGLVIILMALDHTRDFFSRAGFDPVDLAHTLPAWFVTRWITHLCAPVFVFLAGVSAWLYGQQVSRRQLAQYLLSRGSWLVLLECTVISLSWGSLFQGVILLQVIWALGVSMIVLAGLIYLPRIWITLFALLLILGHNTLDTWHGAGLGVWSKLWPMLHERHFYGFGIGDSGAYLLYPLIPWIGVMALGYVFAPVLQSPPPQRERLLLLCAAGLLTLLLVLRIPNWYGDAVPWHEQGRGALYTFFSFINFTKYPPSLQYLCVTLGLGACILAALARVSAQKLRYLQVFGAVPMFFYLLHLPALQIGGAVWKWLQTAQSQSQSQPQSLSQAPSSLLFVYVIWVLYLVGLYFACRWYGAIKRQNPKGWMRYL
jgi:uncharacterized membrane protein